MFIFGIWTKSYRYKSGKNVLQTRLKAFAETIFIDLECFTNSLKKTVTETIHVYNVWRMYQRFAKNARKQSAKRNEINQKRFAEVL